MNLNPTVSTRTKVLEGYRRLGAQQRPGQSYSIEEIAAECDVSPRTIAFDEVKALRKFAKRLLEGNRGLLEEHFTPQKVRVLLSVPVGYPRVTGRGQSNFAKGRTART
jgi:hypothetical protein